MPSPLSIILGKMRLGSFVSSAMLTESSKPTIAKNASEVAVLTASSTFLSSGVSNAMTRDQSALPPAIAHIPIRMTSTRPDSSTSVSTTLSQTLSLTPRRLTNRMSTMNASAMTIVMSISSGRPKATVRLTANARAAVDADVMPEAITMKHTMNVRKWMPKALCVYSAAPAACGYLVTSSR